MTDTLSERAEAAYSLKEAEYPVLTGLSRFTLKQGAQVSLDREGLVEWVARRFGVELDVNDVRLNRDELKTQLVQYSQKTGDAAEEQYQNAESKLSELFGAADPGTTMARTLGATLCPRAALAA